MNGYIPGSLLRDMSEHGHDAESCLLCQALNKMSSPKPTAPKEKEPRTMWDKFVKDTMKDYAQQAQAKEKAIREKQEKYRQEAASKRDVDRGLMVSAFHGLEKELAKLPDNPMGIAGYLLASKAVGKMSSGAENPLARHLTSAARAYVERISGYGAAQKVSLFAQQDGIVVEVGAFSLAVEPTPGVAGFLHAFDRGQFPAITTVTIPVK